MAHNPLLIDASVRAVLANLRALAASRPIDVVKVKEAAQTPGGILAHREAMTALSVVIPARWPFIVTFSIETGHPVGTRRHMSMSVMRDNRIPHPAGVWMVAEELGFVGSLEICRTWIENLGDGSRAVNVVQPIDVREAGNA